MKILAIDTSSKICSVSILEDNNLIIEKCSDDEKTHSQNLMPMIDSIFKDSNLTLDDIQLLACSQGPGSFTGIRIGISTVKAFSDAKSIPIVGVTSLEGLAYNIPDNGLIVSLIDAKNDNVYYSLFNHNNDVYTLCDEFKSGSIDNIFSYLLKYSDPIIFVGNGAIAYHDKIAKMIEHPIFASNIQCEQTSVSIGKSAYNKFKNGIYGDSNSIFPIYLKKSQAERNLNGEK